MSDEKPSLWDLLAEKLSGQPELMAVARANCERWIHEGHSAPERLREWANLLAAAQNTQAGMARLMAVLEGASDEAIRMRDFHPFAGILTREERRLARELCGYRH